MAKGGYGKCKGGDAWGDACFGGGDGFGSANGYWGGGCFDFAPAWTGCKAGGKPKGKIVVFDELAHPNFEEGKWVGGIGENEELTVALREALAPFATDADSPLDDLVTKVSVKINKAASKYGKDARASQRGTATTAKVLLEEFVDSCMNAVSSLFYEKPWFCKVDFGPPLVFAALFIFERAKIFCRTLAPELAESIRESLFKWREEERVQKAMWDALEGVEVKEGYKKKLSKSLGMSYDDAHLKGQYGTTQDPSPEMALVKDFVKGWITHFIYRAWDVLENGLISGTRDEQILFVTVLFQILCDSNSCCVPAEVLSGLQLPPAPWDYVAKAVEESFKEIDAATLDADGQPKKKKYRW